MGIIYIMLIVSLFIAIVFLISFIWATKSGQFDDDYTPSVRILFEDEDVKQKKEEEKQENLTEHGN
ncbi:MAG: cbb3-type cytochrome oxidase assembly protein CcoS [Crocinitomicaceae bacterium]|nr:cbb3-type cytochrome oxidase assembly protein CcoS [Crocinitomicaceae bacterium]